MYEEDYVQGFVDKCAEMEVDVESLLDKMAIPQSQPTNAQLNTSATWGDIASPGVNQVQPKPKGVKPKGKINPTNAQVTGPITGPM